MVQVSSKDQTLRIMAMTRYHFVAGLPRAGAGILAHLLAQNPRFQTTSGGQAAGVFAELSASLAGPTSLGGLDRDTGTALLRGSLDAVHNARGVEAVVIDHNRDWLPHLADVARVLPLSRFILMVRDPAAIAAEWADEDSRAVSPARLMAPDGALGRPIAQIQQALAGPDAERVLLVDRDRLLSDPERVLAVLYGFIREPVFDHEFAHLPTAEAPVVAVPVRRRMMLPLPFKAAKKAADMQPPVWRRMSSSPATMLLSETG